MTSLTSAVVAESPELVKVTVRTPPVLVKVAKVSPPTCRLAPLIVNPLPPPKAKVSAALAEARWPVKTAPA